MIVTLWVVAAVLAVLVGVVGIGVVGAGLTSRQGAPVSEEEVLREVNGLNESSAPTASEPPSSRPTSSRPTSSAPASSGPASSGPTSSWPTSSGPTSSGPTGADPASQSFLTRGGTVVADCDRIISMSPAQGFSVHEQGALEGEFRGTSDNHNRVKVELTCTGGDIHLRVRSEN